MFDVYMGPWFIFFSHVNSQLIQQHFSKKPYLIAVMPLLNWVTVV